jgi:hypothetical protein
VRTITQKLAPPPFTNKSATKLPTPHKDNSAANAKNSGGACVTNRFSALARTPPPPSQKGKMARLASRMCMFGKIPLPPFSVFYLIVYLTFIMLDTVTAPSLTFSSINCNSLNVSDLGSLHHLVKLYGIAKLKTDVIFLSDIRLCNAHGVSNFIKIQDTFRTNPYNAYNCYFKSKSNKRGVGILLKIDSDISVLQELKRDDDNSILLKVSHKGSVFIFASIYGPNTHCPAFFDNLTANLSSLGDHPVVLGGGTGTARFRLFPPKTIRMF